MAVRLIILPGLLMLGACMTAQETGTTQSAARAGATLNDAAGNNRGSVTLSEGAGGMRVSVQAQGLAAGTHGVHFHAVGRCDGPDFQSAGPHWNPAMKQHGRDNPQGAHSGDLPNITIGADGRGTLETTLSDAALAGLLDADGAALLIHASADDYRTDPSGNSGARIACGVIQPR
jgi:superoxide dismutase, Cu-Zn family